MQRSAFGSDRVFEVEAHQTIEVCIHLKDSKALFEVDTHHGFAVCIHLKVSMLFFEVDTHPPRWRPPS